MKQFSNRAQMNIFYVFFTVIIFFLIMGAGFGKMINTTLGIAVNDNHITGIEGFVIDNLLLFIILIFILWILWATQ